MANTKQAERLLDNYEADTELFAKGNLKDRTGRQAYLDAMKDGIRAVGFSVSKENGKYKVREK